MKAIKYRTSILMSGFINGLNLFAFNCHNSSISETLNSTKSNIKVSTVNGFQDDAEKLNGDWSAVRNDLMSSYDLLETSINNATAKQA